MSENTSQTETSAVALAASVRVLSELLTSHEDEKQERVAIQGSANIADSSHGRSFDWCPKKGHQYRTLWDSMKKDGQYL